MDDKNDDAGSSKSSSSGGSFEFVDQLEVSDTNQENSTWQDILGSGDLLKKVLKPGIAEERPVRYDICVINYECSCEDVLIEKKDNFKIQVGDAEMSQAMDLILPLMEVGEKDEIIVKPRFGYGSIGLPPEIPPNSTLRYIVELVSCQPETEAESMDSDERLAIGNSKKERGNFWFSRQDYTTAIQCYKRSLSYLEYNFELLAENPDLKVPSPNEDILLEDRTKVYNNLAAAQMKSLLYEDALTSVEMALCLQPQNVKAWFRKAQILNALNEPKEARRCLKEALRLEPNSRDIQVELSKTKAKAEMETLKEKLLYKKMLGESSENGGRADKKPIPWDNIVMIVTCVVATAVSIFMYYYTNRRGDDSRH